MNEFLFEANNELKRVDHQIYVSLKYTRTVDVLMNCLQRMIDSYLKMIDSLLEYVVEQKIRPEDTMPTTPIERANLVKELNKEDIAQEHMNLFLLFRKIVRCHPRKEQEFRRHVALRTDIDGKEVVVNIDIITEYYAQMREFFEWIEKKIE